MSFEFGPREEDTVHIDQLSANELATQLEFLQEQYRKLRNLNLSLDLTRGKPGADQWWQRVL